jgi:hypothetical protein
MQPEYRYEEDKPVLVRWDLPEVVGKTTIVYPAETTDRKYRATSEWLLTKTISSEEFLCKSLENLLGSTVELTNLFLMERRAHASSPEKKQGN